MWVAQGCSALMPFISDLGLQGNMKLTFKGGLMFCGVLLAITFCDVWVARRILLESGRSLVCARCINHLATAAGFVICIGVGAIGFFPWDENLKAHCRCANAIFFGGVGWSVANA